MFGVKYKCASAGIWFIWVIFHVVVFLTLCRVGITLKISHLLVPEDANIKSSDPIRLECIIEYNTTDKITQHELVAKWYLNNSLLYQWSGGRSAPYINKTYTDRLDPSAVKQTRIENCENCAVSVPLIITKKTTDLTGWYRCQAESFTLQDQDEGFMTMYVPVDNMTLDQTFNNTTNELIVKCGADDVYPKPEIILIVNDERNVAEPKLDVHPNENKHFDITATYSLPINKLQSTTKINCSIALPGVSHISSRSTQYNKSGSDDGESNATVSVKHTDEPDSACSFNEINIKLITLSALTILLNFI